MCPYYILVYLVYGIISAWRTGSESLTVRIIFSLSPAIVVGPSCASGSDGTAEINLH